MQSISIIVSSVISPLWQLAKQWFITRISTVFPHIIHFSPRPVKYRGVHMRFTHAVMHTHTNTYRHFCLLCVILLAHANSCTVRNNIFFALPYEIVEWLSSSSTPAVKICTDSSLSSYLHLKQSNHRSRFKLYWFKYYFWLWVIVFNQENTFEHKYIQCAGNNLV